MSDSKTRYHLDNHYAENPLRFGDVYLVQIGRRYCDPTELIPAHPHLNWFELTIITYGQGVISTNGEETRVQAGDIYLSFPCDVHEIRASETSKLEYDFFSFYCENKALKKDLKGVIRNMRSVNERVFKDEKISDLVKNAITEFSVKNQMYSTELLTDIFRVILIYLIRDFNGVKDTPKNVTESEILCFQLMNYIDTHVYSIYRLEDLASKFNYNYSYLSNLFKRTTGKTLSEYLQHRKMQVAKTLVLERKKNIGEIAEMLGYNLYSFSKAFKQTYGVSPKNMQLR